MIRLLDIIDIEQPRKYKLHLACHNKDGIHPLDEFVSEPANWLGWNQWRGSNNDWNRDYVFSMIEFYPRSDTWLFGGVFQVLERHESRYVLTAEDNFEKYVGRLLISFHRYQGMRRRDYCLENYIKNFEILELLTSRYTGERFPGFEKISHDFPVLESIFRKERLDWKAALSSIKGVYVISDRKNGKSYVGSAYGDMGLWSRWACYIGTGHGWNDELTKIISEKSIAYARENFRFTLLETMSMSASDDTVLQRETFWKNALLSRTHGYNKN